MNIMDSQWNHEANNFAMDNDYEKTFESYISDVDDEDDFNDGREYPEIYQPEQHGEPPEDDQQLNEIFIDIPPQNLRLDMCPVCSRRFAPETLMKHVIICEKINTKKRNQFDSSRQRLKGTEFTGIVASASSPLPSRAMPLRVSPPKTLQRKASETSLKSQPTTSTERRTVQVAMSRKGSTHSLGTPRPLIKRTVQQQNEKCPYCERIFGFKAFDRHVEWCKEKSLIKANPDCASVSAAKERLNTRIHYKAPNLKTKRSVTRDKYSTSCNGSTNSLAEFDSVLHSMSSSMTSENGFYDPFLSAKKQLEELFSPTSAPTTQMINSMMTTPTSATKNNDIMSKSLTLNGISNKSLTSPKTPQPIPKMQSNFKRTSSLRISNRKTKPVIYTPTIKSNVHCGITDDGPVSPNFVKATDYDELPIKSPYSAIKMCEQQQFAQNQMPVYASQSPTMPSIVNKPIMREKHLASIRKNLRLDLKNTNLPSSDYTLSKTDSLALFLKYENELSAQLSAKELKDKSNSLSKRSATVNQNGILDNKLPDINGKQNVQQQKSPPVTNSATKSVNDRQLISIDNLNKSQNEENAKSHSAPGKLINACDNLPLLSSSGSDNSRSPSMDRKVEDETNKNSHVTRRSGNTLRRQMKLNKDNILFDTDPDVKSTPSSSDNSKNNSLIRPESGASNTESIFEDFDLDQFIASFNDDEQFPIFKDYKMLLNHSSKADDENDNNSARSSKSPEKSFDGDIKKNLKDENLNSKPIPIQQQKMENEMSGLEKLDNLCKMLSGNSDSDESNSLETDPSEAQTTRSKSSADSAYGSLSRQSQSPLDYRKMPSYQFKPTPPVPPIRQHLELKTTEIVLNPIKAPTLQETSMPPRNLLLSRTVSTDDEVKLSKFCHECGYKFVVPTAKFCIECGIRRIKM